MVVSVDMKQLCCPLVLADAMPAIEGMLLGRWFEMLCSLRGQVNRSPNSPLVFSVLFLSRVWRLCCSSKRHILLDSGAAAGEGNRGHCCSSVGDIGCRVSQLEIVCGMELLAEMND